MLATLSFMIEIFPKVPITGGIVRMVNNIDVDADFQFTVPP